eukprot:CAMPEP_0172823914 /NCGR_PEP_ID=MMETSP1075-20121228/17640_1 /TAXON_ID=2916 /ORGANISM="Ceratium fusus, Strain PA161109" /LENGTH=46 /DNA_ID= /DNA_START= /DNA_END= /DNA_ORIENTATION=
MDEGKTKHDELWPSAWSQKSSFGVVRCPMVHAALAWKELNLGPRQH